MWTKQMSLKLYTPFNTVGPLVSAPLQDNTVNLRIVYCFGREYKLTLGEESENTSAPSETQEVLVSIV